MADTGSYSDKRRSLTIVLDLAKDMLRRSSGVRLAVLIGATMELVTIALGIAGPYMLKVLVDVLSAGMADPTLILAYVALFIFTWSGANILLTWRMIYSMRVIDRLTARYVAETLRQGLPAAASARDGDSGQTLGLIERLPYSLMVVVDGLIWRTAPLCLQVIGSVWVIVRLIPAHYAAILALVLLGYVVVTWIGGVQHQARATAANIAAGAISQSVGDVLRNAGRVVLNGALDAEVAHIGDQFSQKASANGRMMGSLVLMALCQYGLVSAGLLALLGLGSLDVLAHRMTVGDFVLLQGYAFRLVGPLSGFGFILSQASLSIACVRDVRHLMRPVADAGSEAIATENAAEISLTNVCFSYGPGLPGLSDITAHIAPGSFVVVVGPNGSGKSTLAQVIAGLLPPSTGTVKVDGKDLAKIRRADRHKHILYVPQFIGLFNRPLIANALYPPTTHTEATLAQLLADWHFYEPGREIDLSAAVGEQGERLSGGQIQKLELARIAGVRAPAVILDESTSALDPVSEAAVIRSLREGFGDRTTLILISHRIQMAELADQVWFMKAGSLVRNGRHDVLMRDSASYKALWRSVPRPITPNKASTP
jgi:ABC-type multidrug transport system fused ATPase/permease subunit